MINRNRVKIFGAFTVVITLFAATSFAAKTAPKTATAKSTAKTESLLSQVQKNTSISYFGAFTGPSLGKPSGNDTPTPDAATGNGPVNLYNSISIGYKLAPNWSVGANPRFQWNMMNGMGQDLQMLNPRVYLTRANLINTEEYNLKGNFNTDVYPAETNPPGKNPHDRKLFMAPALSATFSYTPSATRWTFGAGTYFRTYFYSSSIGLTGLADNGRDMRFYLAPSATYKLTSKLSATTQLEFDSEHPRTKSSMVEWNNIQTDLQTGIVYDITEKFSLNPYVMIFPGGHINWDTTSLGMYISGSIL